MSKPSLLTILSALTLMGPIGRSESYTWTTVAGLARSAGSADGVGPVARFQDPSSVAVDPNGNAYVAEFLNYTIRMVSPTGFVTTIAGVAGQEGSADGVGSNARFNSPRAIAVDRGGSIYVGDYTTVRVISPEGVVRTLAGRARVTGSNDGIGDAARFYSIGGIAVDASGTLYVTDYFNNTVKRITPAGVVSTIAGLAGDTCGSIDGNGSSARFGGPAGLAVDAVGNIYVADSISCTIRKITPSGDVSTFAGKAGTRGSADGVGATARFFTPMAVAVNADGSLIVGDADNNLVRQISTAGTVTTIGGMTGRMDSVDGVGSDARFGWIRGVAIDSTGVIWLADQIYCTVRKGVPASRIVSENSGHLSNISILARIETGETMTVGAVVKGMTVGGSKPLVIRAGGPALTQFAISSVLPDPAITLNNTTNSPPGVVASNNDWNGTGVLANVFAQVGAFPFGSLSSKDAALYQSALTAGNYTVQVNDAGSGSGTVIVELYDATPAANFTAATPRLINLSVLKDIGSGLTAGFVIGGNSAKTVLVRAVGPTLATTFGLTGVLNDPQITLLSGQTAIGANDNWGTPIAPSVATAAQLAAAFTQVGAFVLPLGSKDAALLVALAPGNYTVLVNGVNKTGGVAIVEVYEVP